MQRNKQQPQQQETKTATIEIWMCFGWNSLESAATNEVKNQDLCIFIIKFSRLARLFFVSLFQNGMQLFSSIHLIIVFIAAMAFAFAFWLFRLLNYSLSHNSVMLFSFLYFLLAQSALFALKTNVTVISFPFHLSYYQLVCGDKLSGSECISS